MEISAAPDAVAPGGLGWRGRLVGQMIPVLLFVLVGNLGRYSVFLYLHGSGDFTAYLGALCVWDCAWYRTIVEHGYDLAPVDYLRPGGANWAFFPLYPISVAALTRLGLPTLVAGFLASSVFIGAAAMVGRSLVRGNRTWWLWSFALLAGPFSMLFATLYTESLFILLLLLSLRAVSRQRYIEAGFWAALLSATRVTGVLMAVAILVGALVDQRRRGVPWRHLPLALLQRSDLVLGLFIAPMGLFIYMAFMQALTGDGLAFMHIQRPWGREFDNPLLVLWQALTIPFPWSPDALIRMTWGVAAALGLLLSIALALTSRQAAGTFTALALLASLSSGVTSMIRFCAGLAPLGILVAEIISLWRWLYYLAFPLSFLLGLVITLGWYRSSLFVM